MVIDAIKNGIVIDHITAGKAMELYRSVFGGKLEMNTFGEFGAPEGVDPNGIMHAQLSTPDGFRAIDGNCPHRGGPLSDGLVADSCVTCPLHNWRVDLTTGEVVGGGEAHASAAVARHRTCTSFARVR